MFISIRHWDSNPQPPNHESHPITTSTYLEQRSHRTVSKPNVSFLANNRRGMRKAIRFDRLKFKNERTKQARPLIVCGKFSLKQQQQARPAINHTQPFNYFVKQTRCCLHPPMCEIVCTYASLWIPLSPIGTYGLSGNYFLEGRILKMYVPWANVRWNTRMSTPTYLHLVNVYPIL